MLGNWPAITAMARASLERVAPGIDPRKRVSDLTRTEKSLVAIARALGVHAGILVLDEPTASLPQDDVAVLFDVLRELKRRDVSMIYVSHRLDEIFAISDRLLVLRDGRAVDARPTAQADAEGLVRSIIGRPPEKVFVRPPAPTTAEPVLECDSLVTGPIGPISFSLKRGEVLGLVGLRGAGHELISRTLIGAERQYRLRTAGLRTNVLVAVSAAAFVDIGMHLSGADGAVRIIAYVVSGIGFLGAGAIMKEGMNVRGLNTAATLWGSAAVGSCAGADLIAQGVLLAAFVLAGNTLLRPLVNAIERAPLDVRTSEATYQFRLTVDADALADLRELLVEKLEASHYPVLDVEVTERADDSVEIVATLVSSAVEQGELDTIAAELERSPGVRHATWDVTAPD